MIKIYKREIFDNHFLNYEVCHVRKRWMKIKNFHIEIYGIFFTKIFRWLPTLVWQCSPRLSDSASTRPLKGRSRRPDPRIHSSRVNFTFWLFYSYFQTLSEPGSLASTGPSSLAGRCLGRAWLSSRKSAQTTHLRREYRW